MAGERAALVTLSGDLDLSKRDAVADALPAAGSVDRLVVDCSAVTSIESVVIAVFMRYRRKFIAAGSDPMNVVFIVSPQVRRTFEITGMFNVFHGRYCIECWFIAARRTARRLSLLIKKKKAARAFSFSWVGRPRLELGTQAHLRAIHRPDDLVEETDVADAQAP